MSAVQVLKFPLSVDLAGFVGLLRRLNVPHRVSEESGQQVLWVPDERLDRLSEMSQSIATHWSRPPPAPSAVLKRTVQLVSVAFCAAPPMCVLPENDAAWFCVNEQPV